MTPFGYPLTAAKIYAVLRDSGCAGTDVALRESAPNFPVVTDGGNFVLDCKCRSIPHAGDLAERLKRITGVVEHGLFIGMARTVIVGKAKSADVMER